MMRRAAILVLLSAANNGVLGCSDAHLGDDPEFIWWSDHESGDLRDWTADGAGYAWTNEGGNLEFVSQPTRSGRFSVRASVVATNEAGRISSALLSRREGLPQAAYFSAWFYVPQPIVSTSYWLLFKFRSTSGTELWDIDVAEPREGAPEPRIRLYSHQSGTDVPALSGGEPILPLAHWFQIEAFYRAASDPSGQLSIWLDGDRVFEVTNRVTAPDANIEWGVGAATETMSPNTASLYVDDAAVTTRRLGPDFPAFTRHK